MAQPDPAHPEAAAVDVQIRGRTALVTINRPESRNAVSREVALGLEAALDRVEGDDDVLTVVLTGAGTAFCAGADLGAFVEGRASELFTDRGGFAGFVQRPRTKPVIAAVNGAALGGGFELALACDLVVASRNARFGLPEVKLSLIAAGGGLVHLPRLLPKQLALRVLLTGDPIDAETAYAHGIVTELAEPGESVDRALVMADAINANGPLAVRASLRLALSSPDLDPAIVFRASREALDEVARSEDGVEGPRAFLDKRAPVWKGR